MKLSTMFPVNLPKAVPGGIGEAVVVDSESTNPDLSGLKAFPDLLKNGVAALPPELPEQMVETGDAVLADPLAVDDPIVADELLEFKPLQGSTYPTNLEETVPAGMENDEVVDLAVTNTMPETEIPEAVESLLPIAPIALTATSPAQNMAAGAHSVSPSSRSDPITDMTKSAGLQSIQNQNGVDVATHKDVRPMPRPELLNMVPTAKPVEGQSLPNAPVGNAVAAALSQTLGNEKAYQPAKGIVNDKAAKLVTYGMVSVNQTSGAFTSTLSKPVEMTSASIRTLSGPAPHLADQALDTSIKMTVGRQENHFTFQPTLTMSQLPEFITRETSSLTTGTMRGPEIPNPAITQSAAQNLKRIEVQLVPRNLGVVEITVQRDNNGIQIMVRAETAEAEKLIASERNTIQEAMRNAGLALDDLKVVSLPPADRDANGRGGKPLEFGFSQEDVDHQFQDADHEEQGHDRRLEDGSDADLSAGEGRAGNGDPATPRLGIYL